MKYIKNFNNNAALVVDEHQTEWIVLGNGVGFGHHPGDHIPKDRVARYFKADTANSEVLDTLGNFPSAITDATLQVVKAVETTLQVQFTDYQYLILADHIDFACTRARNGITLSDPANKWEVRQLFPKEFEAARQAILTLDAALGIDLPDDEATYLTYHFVNVKNEQENLQDTIAISQLTVSVIKIVQLQYQMTLDAESFNYSRFVSHLRYFFIRKIKGDTDVSQALDPSLLMLMRSKYPRESAVVNIITNYLHKARGWEMADNDKVYLILHVWRVTHREQTK
ncbi:PRD domain-containing protein [Lactiplantibacillus daowaiensis]|uniref:PRD domain-containing protein n=1 Tax=Lactiplantibacillus daowaiensis TaxID=2559918 RepID=A0ABW1S4G1_9LACO|nr:PRD domain-containing protein [Lactiplantibacillus daowaiensis]